MAQYYDFFFSFSSIDWKRGMKDDLQRLFCDLEQKLKEFGRTSGGFFAPDDIDRGEKWEPKLATALRASRVLVPLYSPNYFNSLYCGKEWQVFSERYDENKTRPPKDVVSPDVILPVLWTADFLRFPDRVSPIQHKKGIDPDAYVNRGLGYMMQSPRRFGDQYHQFVHRFGGELARMAEAQGEPKMRNISAVDDLAPPFPTGYKHGLRYVRYVFLAGRRDEMADIRKDLASYGMYENRHDWRPCFPGEDVTVGDIATSVANETQKEFEFVQPGEALLSKLVEAKKLNNIIVVVVDPWSLQLHAFDQFVKTFDAEESPSSGVVVAWSETDDETRYTLPELQNRMNLHFTGRQARNEHFASRITTLVEFRKALINAFNSAREKLVERGDIRSATASTSTNEPQPLLRVGEKSTSALSHP